MFIIHSNEEKANLKVHQDPLSSSQNGQHQENIQWVGACSHSSGENVNCKITNRSQYGSSLDI